MKKKTKIKTMEQLGVVCYDKDYSIVRFGTFNFLIIKDRKIVGYAMSFKKCKKIIENAKKNNKMIYGDLPWFILGD